MPTHNSPSGPQTTSMPVCAMSRRLVRSVEQRWKAKARARSEQALLLMMKALAKGQSQRLKVSQENDLGLVDLADSLVVVNDLDEDHTEETVVASAVEPMERPLEVASAVEEHGFMNEGNEWEVMEEPEAPSDFALGPGFGAKDDVDETMEPSAAEAMEESEAASTVDAAMTAHDNGNNNEEIDDDIRLSELVPQVPNHDSLESSSLSPSPSTPSPPTPPGPEVENSGPHAAQVEEPGPGEEVVAEEPGAAGEAASRIRSHLWLKPLAQAFGSSRLCSSRVV